MYINFHRKNKQILHVISTNRFHYRLWGTAITEARSASTHKHVSMKWIAQNLSRDSAFVNAMTLSISIPSIDYCPNSQTNHVSYVTLSYHVRFTRVLSFLLVVFIWNIKHLIKQDQLQYKELTSRVSCHKICASGILPIVESQMWILL